VIGRPLANTQVYILDHQIEPVPVGLPGELYIGGAGLARGYLNRGDLTAERFVSDPFAGAPGARMYRTGDLARWLPDGTVEFLGRLDHQVKVRGYRIELGEIEARLVEHEALREAVVMAREEAAGDKRLVAYYISVGGVVEVEELRQYLLARLPEYMVPAAYVQLDQMPLTANGKLDRKALPAPDGDAYAVRGYEEPLGEIEAAVAEIWMELLKLKRVGRHDNFFDIGGHSLLAVRLISRLRKNLNVEVAMADLFAHPSLATLSERIINLQLEQFDPETLESLMSLMRESAA
jgi:acyl carrier protein